MVTAILQFVAAVLGLAFAILAFRVARSAGERSVRHGAWIVVAVAFLWRTVPETLQSAMAFLALHAGAGSVPYELFVRWTPAVNHGRTLVAVVLGWGLALLPLMRGQPAARMWQGAWVAVPALGLAGFYAGWSEGPLSATHVAVLSVLGMVELVGLLLALQIALFAHTMDRYLWIFLCGYAVQLAVKIVWYTGATSFFLGNDWYPPAWGIPLVTVPAYVGGILLAARRLEMGRSGIPIPFVFEPGPGPVLSGPRVRS